MSLGSQVSAKKGFVVKQSWKSCLLSPPLEITHQLGECLDWTPFNLVFLPLCVFVHIVLKLLCLWLLLWFLFSGSVVVLTSGVILPSRGHSWMSPVGGGATDI